MTEEEQISIFKKIEVQALNDTQENLDSVSASFIHISDFPIALEFPNAKSFKFIENVFRNQKQFEHLAFHIDLTDEKETQFYVENDKDNGGETFKVIVDKLKKLTGVPEKFKFVYSAKLLIPAFQFLTKSSQTTFKIDQQGTLFITS